MEQHARMVQVAKLATAAGAIKAVPLAVSGAFHTSLMQPAREALVEVVLHCTLSCISQIIYLNKMPQCPFTVLLVSTLNVNDMLSSSNE